MLQSWWPWREGESMLYDVLYSIHVFEKINIKRKFNYGYILISSWTSHHETKTGWQKSAKIGQFRLNDEYLTQFRLMNIQKQPCAYGLRYNTPYDNLARNDIQYPKANIRTFLPVSPSFCRYSKQFKTTCIYNTSKTNTPGPRCDGATISRNPS